MSDIIIWIVGDAFVMFININNAREADYFRKRIVDNIRFVVRIEFIADLYVLNLSVDSKVRSSLSIAWSNY